MTILFQRLRREAAFINRQVGRAEIDGEVDLEVRSALHRARSDCFDHIVSGLQTEERGDVLPQIGGLGKEFPTFRVAFT